ncbi:CDP-alcohol phosphatidyltransferase family protein [bacterium]|nr:MAG: CDP-alcohol phosphatidyltransferase family protein [bacterium]
MNIACILADTNYPLFADRTVYGLRFVERLQRQFREFKFDEVLFVSDLPSPTENMKSINIPDLIRFANNLDIQQDIRLFMVMSNVIMDDRLIKFTRDHNEDIQLTEQGGFVKLSGSNLKSFIHYLSQVKDISQLIDFTKKQKDPYSIKIVTPNNFDSYIEDLRLNFVPYYFQYEKDSDLRSIENQMYEANFKGTMDFIATYIYKYPVREITRFLSRYPSVNPNYITFLSILASFAVPSLFALGYMGLAVLTGWCMFIFDSVDGKLARLTVRLSRTAGIIEHATSAPAIFLWFAGLTWHFANGRFFAFDNINTIAGWTLMTLYWVDKTMCGIFRIKFKREIYDFAIIDKTFHLIACRRAIILLIVTVGYIAGLTESSFHFLAFWMVCSFVFHLLRLIWISASLSISNSHQT